ncbi:MAG: RNA-binding S4 domain-containing protein [Synergistaceae bacterium]|jgi:ribosomal 50S subunit-recycling heat shock protein|nr:RNA-binding S4 domain-containing protein [Synergistaceae bacterium]
MRLDKFLKLSRIVRRRTLAAEMVEVGAVRLNGRAVKPSAVVRDGDRIEIAFPRRLLAVEVLTVDERAVKRGEKSFDIAQDKALGDEEKPWK